MKALTLYQPWASAIAFGLKQFETRSWGTDYRGALLIHAGKKVIKTRTLERQSKSVDLTNLTPQGWFTLPKKYIVAIGILVDCVEIDDKLISQQSEQELDLGRWERGRYAWKLSAVIDLQSLNPRLRERGFPGLWEPSQLSVDRIHSYLCEKDITCFEL